MTKRSTYQPSESMSMYGGRGGATSSVSIMSSASGVPSKALQLKLDSKVDAKEDRKLDRLAAEAQAFLLNNQKKNNITSDEASSVSSMSKGTVQNSTAQSVKSMRKPAATKGKVGGTSAMSVASAKTSFSKQGKTL